MMWGPMIPLPATHRRKASATAEGRQGRGWLAAASIRSSGAARPPASTEERPEDPKPSSGGRGHYRTSDTISWKFVRGDVHSKAVDHKGPSETSGIKSAEARAVTRPPVSP